MTAQTPDETGPADSGGPEWDDDHPLPPPPDQSDLDHVRQRLDSARSTHRDRLSRSSRAAWEARRARGGLPLAATADPDDPLIKVGLHLNLPSSDMARIDARAEELGISRREWFRRAILHALDCEHGTDVQQVTVQLDRSV